MFGKKLTIDVSDDAAARLMEMIKSKNMNGIRIRLVSNGCGAYIYDMDFGTKRVGDEIETEARNIKFFISRKSLVYLNGLTIKYDTEKEGFVFDNPNIKK
jgi:iron-sulfur cluster assembly accessory protein